MHSLAAKIASWLIRASPKDLSSRDGADSLRKECRKGVQFIEQNHRFTAFKAELARLLGELERGVARPVLSPAAVKLGPSPTVRIISDHVNVELSQQQNEAVTEVLDAPWDSLPKVRRRALEPAILELCRSGVLPAYCVLASIGRKSMLMR
jgi:hypothetical protein